ncbi:DUF3871 family protein [Bacteroidota bacterium]
MEVITNNNDLDLQVQTRARTEGNFLESNTVEMDLETIQTDHLVPVFTRDNEPCISHAQFIETVERAADDYFNELPSIPAIRVSHEVKGRIPEARHKSAKELLPHERTTYYERCAFMMDIPSIQDEVSGNLMKLTVGGVKSFSQDNLFNYRSSGQHFQFFIGFKNVVCLNLCVFSDGFSKKLVCNTDDELYNQVSKIIEGYDAVKHLDQLRRFGEYELSEKQFAQLIGRARMYPHLTKEEKEKIPGLELSDTQINRVVEYYYKDENFARSDDGSIDLWRLFNCFTGANRASSYIDKFLERAAGSHSFVSGIASVLESKSDSWFLN